MESMAFTSTCRHILPTYSVSQHVFLINGVITAQKKEIGMKRKNVAVLIFVTLFFVVSGVQSAFALETKITLDIAKKMIQAVEVKAKEIGVPMVATVLNEGGNMVAQHRMDDALLVSVEVSLNKAYSAVALKLPTDKLGELSQPGAMLYGLQNVGRMVVFGGGYPLKAGDKVIGAIGVSGGSVDEDTACAKAGLAVFEAMQAVPQ